MTGLRSFSTRVPIIKGSTRNPSTTTPLHVTYPELSRLPKAPKVRSVRFKRTNPGSVSHLSFGPETTPVVDPSHPLAYLRPYQLMRVVPRHHCSLFEAHAYPHAVLRKFAFPEQMIQLKDKGSSSELADAVSVSRQTPHQSPGSEKNKFLRPITVGDRRRASHTVPMSLMIVTPKKPLHKSGAIRTKIKLRMKEALNLVVIRGASLQGPEKRIRLFTPEGLRREDIQTGVILQGWTYVIRPSLEVYRCPWPSLLEHLKEGLLKIQSHAKGLEDKWAEKSRQRGLPKVALSQQQKTRSRQRSDANSNAKRIHTGHFPNTSTERNYLELPERLCITSLVGGPEAGVGAI